MKQTKIPAGYRITVTTWEDDADNYNTEIVEGLNKTEVAFFVDACKQFYSRNRDANCIGNMYDPSPKELKKFQDCMVALVARHPEMVNSEHFKDYFEEMDDEDKEVYEDEGEYVSSWMSELLYDFGLTSGEFFTRVCESFKVEYVPVEITLEDVTEEFV